MPILVNLPGNLPGAAAPVLLTNVRTYEARGPDGPSVHKEAHLPLTFPFKNCFEGVHSLIVDIFLLQPIPSVANPLREEKAPHIKFASGFLDLCCRTSCIISYSYACFLRIDYRSDLLMDFTSDSRHAMTQGCASLGL